MPTTKIRSTRCESSSTLRKWTNLWRQALQMCWMMLPKGRRNADELESQFRRIVELALKDMRDDGDAFGTS